MSIQKAGSFFFALSSSLSKQSKQLERLLLTETLASASLAAAPSAIDIF